jgi:hypothetical protein
MLTGLTADPPVVADTLVVLDTPCPLSLEVIFSYYSATMTSFFNLIVGHKSLPSHDLFYIILDGKLGSRIKEG